MSPRNRGCSIVSHDFPGDLRTRLAEVEHGIGLRPAMATLRPGRFCHSTYGNSSGFYCIMVSIYLSIHRSIHRSIDLSIQRSIDLSIQRPIDQ